MQAEIITIGDELLIGQVVDTNSAWMGKELNKAGITVHRISSVSDTEEDILAILQEAVSRTPIVLITGGLGPTRDDITKAALCKFFNTRLVFNEEVYSDVENFLKHRVHRINTMNRDQAMVPEACTVIRNKIGTAPIMWFKTSKGVVVSMPGVPSEMKDAMQSSIIPRIANEFVSEVLIHKTVHIFDIPEAMLAERLSGWEDELAANIKVAYLPQAGKIRLRLSSKGNDRDKLERLINEAIDKLYVIVGDNIFGFDEQLAEEELIKLLRNKAATISCAESCSGGYLSHLFTSVPGASDVFAGGIVAYSNKVKEEQLGVPHSLIEQDGAVSKAVVEAMALGACKVLHSDYAIATSGIAGPSGGSSAKPVGTVWIAWAAKDKAVSRLFNFGNGRERIIKRSGDAGVILLKQMIEKEEL